MPSTFVFSNASGHKTHQAMISLKLRTEGDTQVSLEIPTFCHLTGDANPRCLPEGGNDQKAEPALTPWLP
jgi:hypothetical protein